MESSPRTVLVVHPSPLEAAALGEALRGAGFEVELVTEGPAAVKLATTGAVDLVLLSVELQGMDGLQVLRMLRSWNPRRFLPVMLTSSSVDRKLAALQLGADDFLVQPHSPDEVVVRAQRLVAIRHRMDALLAETAELRKNAATDPLTQLLNHRSFREKLAEEFRRARRYDTPLSLLLLDLDRFRAVNDRLGLVAGDQVLQEVAAQVVRCVRETDIVARYGGEEFAVLLPNTSLGRALTVAERVRSDLANLRCGPSKAVQLTASLGLASSSVGAPLSADQLFRAADAALYRAKKLGRDRIFLHQSHEPVAGAG